jgi:hypothetical protein
MTNQELNRDIKRLYNKIESLKNSNKENFYTFMEGEVKKEFIRLYRADDTAEVLTKDNLLRMMTLNRRYRFVSFRFINSISIQSYDKI